MKTPAAKRSNTSLQPFTLGEHGAVGVWLDRQRLHLQHGPIELVIRCRGEQTAVDTATAAACERFKTVLPELCTELPLLRKTTRADRRPRLSIARRMYDTASQHRDRFVTPMAAVAGAVADEILDTMTRTAPELAHITVNNGGDIAVHLDGNETARIDVAVPDEMFALPPAISAEISLQGGDGIGGVASSGWQGRSWSLGIADQVTVTAPDAATADCAATLIANAINVASSRVRRAPATSLEPDSDLGQLPVTVEVAPLRSAEIEAALERGAAEATALITSERICGALLRLQGRQHVVGSENGFAAGGESEQIHAAPGTDW